MRLDKITHDYTIESGFYIKPNERKVLYTIESGNMFVASVVQIMRLKEEKYGRYYIGFEYQLIYNQYHDLSSNEKQMIRIYFDNLVNTLTHDMQTIYEDNIEERMNLPFYQNILHLKPYKD